jgi:hypothetical protein
MADTGQYTGLTWFNGKVLGKVVALIILPATLGHKAIAARDDISEGCLLRDSIARF